MSFIEGFASTFALVVSSELGDKSFILAAALAARYGRGLAFSAVYSALLFMTVFAAFAGVLSSSSILMIPNFAISILGSMTYLVFGLRMISEARDLSSEKQLEVEKPRSYEDSLHGTPYSQDTLQNDDAGIDTHWKINSMFVKIFIMTCAAELGDKSQITTLLLGATKNVYGLMLGGACGHVVCTGIAVIGGNAFANRISSPVVTYLGGALLLFFSASLLCSCI